MSLDINDLKFGIQENIFSLKSLTDSLEGHSKKLQNIESYNNIIKLNEKNVLIVKNTNSIENTIRDNILSVIDFLKRNEQIIKNGPGKIDARQYLDNIYTLKDHKDRLDLTKSTVFKNTQLQLVSIIYLFISQKIWMNVMLILLNITKKG